MAAISVADGMSERICSVTEQPGELGRDDGWYSTPEVRTERHKDRRCASSHPARHPAPRSEESDDDDCMEPPALPRLATRMTLREAAIAALKRRHPRVLATVKVLDILPGP